MSAFALVSEINYYHINESHLLWKTLCMCGSVFNKIILFFSFLWRCDLFRWSRHWAVNIRDSSMLQNYIWWWVLYFDLRPKQKCHSKVMHRKEVTHSNGSYERKSRWRKLDDEMGRAKKFPWYTHILMHGKRVTCELHDSYFRLMMIKHSISKIEWALNYYIAQSRRKSSGQLSCSRDGDEMW